MIAPAIAGQFPGNIYQLKTAIVKAGFTDVYEVAQGADITANIETQIKMIKKGISQDRVQQAIANQQASSDKKPFYSKVR